MKKLLLVIALLVGQAWATPTLLVNASCGGTGGANCTTAGINTTGANLIVVGISAFLGSTIAAPTDSKGNTWSLLANKQSAAGTINGRLFYVVGPTVGAGHTFSTSNNATFPSLTVMAFSGVLQTSPFDVQNQGTAASTTVQTGSITPGQNGELLIAYLAYGVSESTHSINSGFSTPVGIDASGSNHIGSWMAYLVQGSAAAINPTWTVNTSDNLVANIASFKAIANATVPRKSGGAIW